jgi:hypothetical protein
MRSLSTMLAVFVMFGCGSASVGFNQTGTFRNTSIRVIGEGVVSCPGTQGSVTCGSDDRLILRGDQSVRLNRGVNVYTGTWSAYGALSFELTHLNGSLISPIQGQTGLDLSNDAYIVTLSTEPGLEFVFTRQ